MQGTVKTLSVHDTRIVLCNEIRDIRPSALTIFPGECHTLGTTKAGLLLTAGPNHSIQDQREDHKDHEKDAASKERQDGLPGCAAARIIVLDSRYPTTVVVIHARLCRGRTM